MFDQYVIFQNLKTNLKKCMMQALNLYATTQLGNVSLRLQTFHLLAFGIQSFHLK
jgi:hypothetical protein